MHRGTARDHRTLAVGRGVHVRAAARIRFCRRAGGGRLAAVVDPDRLAVLQCRRGDWAVAVRRSRAGRDRRWLARGTTASIVATRLALAHRAVCHWWPRELLAESQAAAHEPAPRGDASSRPAGGRCLGRCGEPFVLVRREVFAALDKEQNVDERRGPADGRPGPRLESSSRPARSSRSRTSSMPTATRD